MTETFFNYRPLTKAELAAAVIQSRKERGWTQETLAALTKLQTRTIQRIENGEGGNLDTRMAIAMAFDYPHDFFDNFPIPNVEAIKSEQERIERETSLLPLSVVSTGKQLREWSETGSAFWFCSLTEVEGDAEEQFAELQDYLKEYADCEELYSSSQKIEVNATLQVMIDKIKEYGFLVGAANRKMLHGGKHPFVCVHVVIGPAEGFPETIRVPKKGSMRF